MPPYHPKGISFLVVRRDIAGGVVLRERFVPLLAWSAGAAGGDEIPAVDKHTGEAAIAVHVPYKKGYSLRRFLSTFFAATADFVH